MADLRTVTGSWLEAAWEPFCDLLRVEETDGRAAARGRLSGLREAYLATRALGGEMPLAEATGDEVWTLARTRGVWALWMLRERMGPPAFDQACGRWREGHAPQGIAAVCERLEGAGAAGLAQFVRFWVETTGLPDYHLLAATARRRPAGYEVTLRIANRGEGPVPAPAVARTEEGALHEFEVSAGAGERQEVRFSVLTRPVAAALDPDGDLLTASGERRWTGVRVRLWGIF